jgi:hypothetical protein
VQRSAAFLGVANLLKMERETGIEPATSSLGISISIDNTELMRQGRPILSMQVLEKMNRTVPHVPNRSNRSNNNFAKNCFESPRRMPAEFAGRQQRDEDARVQQHAVICPHSPSLVLRNEHNGPTQLPDGHQFLA